MADNMINLAGGQLPPTIATQQAEATRQQQLANLLTQQGAQPLPGGSMVSGRFVPTSPFQNLAQIGNLLAGNYLAGKATEQSQKTAQALRDYYGEEFKKYKELQKTNPDEALQFGVTAYNPILAQTATKRMTEGPNWAEVSEYNPKTGNTDTYVYDKNSPNPISTKQFVATSKPALSPADVLRLNDSGIGTGGFGGPSIPNVGGAPTGNVPTGNAPAGNVMPPAGTAGARPAVAPTAVVKPVTATGASESDLVKTYGYDPFKPPQMPPMPSGEAARAWKADLYKPLTGTAADQVTGAKLYQDTLTKYNDYVSGLTAADLAKPSVRQMLTSLHSQVKLTGKEANKLGVLNGGDERILNEVIPNYSDILVTKENLKKMIQGQKEFGSNIIVNAYGTQQKPVPENMRKYVVVPQIKEEAPKTGAPKQTGATARAMLNGRQIEVRNGRWVDSQTGQEIK